MRIVARWRARLQAVFRRDALDRELDRELQDWVDELTARYQHDGLPAAEARRRALVETGGVAQAKEQPRLRSWRPAA
jgi:putative ABC transport system permease protein